MTTTETNSKVDRRQFVGASDVPAILGLDKYRSPFRVYQEKVGEVEPFAGNDLTRLGTRFERVVAEMWAERHGKLLNGAQRELRHRSLPLVAHVDFDGLEVKCSSALDWGEGGTDEVPATTMAQVQTQLLLSGLPEWHVAALLWGNYGPPELRSYTVPSSDDWGRLIEAAVERFWECVSAGTPPDPVDMHEVWEQVGHTEGKTSVASDEDIETVRKLARIQAAAKTLDTEADAIKLALSRRLGDSEGLVGPDGAKLVTWKPQVSRRIKREMVEEILGDRLDEVLVESSSRPFIITKHGKALAGNHD